MRSHLAVMVFLGLLGTDASADTKLYTLKAVRPAGTCIQVTGTTVVAGECSRDATWTVTPAAGGFHKIVSSTGSCLDILNDGKANNQVRLAACGNASGQLWKFTPFGSAGEQYLTTSWRGDGQCLGVFDDTKLQLAECRQVANLRWKLEPAAAAAPAPRVGSRPEQDPEPRSPRPTDNRADRDGALMTRISWAPTFLIRTKPCSILLPTGSPDEPRTTKNYPLAFECQRDDANITCAIHTDLDTHGHSDYMFVAAVQKTPARTLQFATPKKLISVAIDLAASTATISQRLPDGATATCTGTYDTVEADLAKRKAAAAERRRQEDANGGPRTGPAAPVTPRAPAVKGSARGKMCSKDKDCQSGACVMENKTRGRCN